MKKDKGYISTASEHKIYFETFGSKEDTPILFLHGGPGYGFFDVDKRFFIPERHYVILYDQRGAGRSKPYGSVEHNTTDDLVDDILLILDHFNIEKVILFGGSWGSTLALLFAIKYPERVRQMILRGIFSAAHNSIDLFADVEGNTHLESCRNRVLSFVPDRNPEMAGAYFLKKMRFGTQDEKEIYAYELELYGSVLNFPEKPVSELELEIKKRPFFAHAIIIAHYMVNKFFLPDNYIWDHLGHVKDIPTIIVHGTQDKLCPLENAKHLHSKMDNSTLFVVEGGHSSLDPVIDQKLKDIMKTV